MHEVFGDTGPSHPQVLSKAALLPRHDCFWKPVLKLIQALAVIPVDELLDLLVDLDHLASLGSRVLGGEQEK